MRSQGVSAADVKDRGNYAAGADVAKLTYDYSTAGHGPLSSNLLRGGCRPEVADIKRYLSRNSISSAAPLGGLREGDRQLFLVPREVPPTGKSNGGTGRSGARVHLAHPM